MAPGKAAAKTKLQQCYSLVQELQPDWGLLDSCLTLGWLKNGKSTVSTAAGASAALHHGALDNHSPFATPTEGQYIPLFSPTVILTHWKQFHILIPLFGLSRKFFVFLLDKTEPLV